jgi:hypothetical protein
MSWEVKDGRCAECGEYGSWLEFIDVRQLPEGWFIVTAEMDAKADHVILCSVRCVQARNLRAPKPDPSSSSPHRE